MTDQTDLILSGRSGLPDLGVGLAASQTGPESPVLPGELEQLLLLDRLHLGGSFAAEVFLLQYRGGNLGRSGSLDDVGELSLPVEDLSGSDEDVTVARVERLRHRRNHAALTEPPTFHL